MMTSEDLKTKILQKIKNDNIKPIEKWKIDLANDAFWSGFVFLATLSGLSLSAVVYFLFQTDWRMPQNIAMGRLEYVLSVLPYFWIILLALFLVLSYFNIRNTRKGYRYEFKKITGVTFLIVFASGSIIYVSRAHVAVDDVFFRNVPLYVHMTNSKELVWSRPDKGLLGGMIILVEPEFIEIEDFNGTQWKVVSADGALVQPRVELKPNKEIKVVGRVLEDHVFDANEIRPWTGRARYMGDDPVEREKMERRTRGLRENEDDEREE